MYELLLGMRGEVDPLTIMAKSTLSDAAERAALRVPVVPAVAPAKLMPPVAPVPIVIAPAVAPAVAADLTASGDEPASMEEEEEDGDDEPLTERQTQLLKMAQRLNLLRAGAASPTTSDIIDHYFLFSDVTGVKTDEKGFSIGRNTHYLLSRGKYKWMTGNTTRRIEEGDFIYMQLKPGTGNTATQFTETFCWEVCKGQIGASEGNFSLVPICQNSALSGYTKTQNCNPNTVTIRPYVRILNEEEKEVFKSSYMAFKWDFKAVKWTEAVECPVIGPLSTWLVDEPLCILQGAWMSDASWAICPQRGDAMPIDSLTDDTRVVPLRVVSERMHLFEYVEQEKAAKATVVAVAAAVAKAHAKRQKL